MARGGKREGAGRKPGAATKRTREIADAAAEGVTPLEFLLEIMRNEELTLDARADAAKAAAPYVHPRLSAVDMNAKVKQIPHEDALGELE